MLTYYPHRYITLLYLNSFPTRRSSDLFGSADGDLDAEMVAIAGAIIRQRTGQFDPSTYRDRYQEALQQLVEAKTKGRSEEHTSELQSPDQLVCRLLLEKKNKTKYIYTQ